MKTHQAEVPREVVEQLTQRYKAMQKAMRTLDAQAEAQATRWEWTTGEYYSLRPLYAERFAMQRGRILPGDPNKAGDLRLFGFDAQGRLLTRCLYRRFAEPDEADYMLYDEQGIEVICYANTHFNTDDAYIMQGVGRLHGKVEQPEWYCEVVSAFGIHVIYEHYRYEADRLVEVHLQQRAGLEADAPAHPQIHEISYDAQGRPDVTVVDLLMPRARTPRPTKMIVDLDAIRQQLQQTIIEALHANLAQLHGEARGPFCCLRLSYDAVADDGTVIALMLEADRAEFMNETYDRWFDSLQMHNIGSVYHRQYMFSVGWPAEPTSYIEDCRKRHDWQSVRGLFAQVGRSLNDDDWQTILDVTDDFIVFAHDREDTGDIERYILECVPENKLNLWRVNGWFS